MEVTARPKLQIYESAVLEEQFLGTAHTRLRIYAVTEKKPD
jgi:hypothetical protein